MFDFSVIHKHNLFIFHNNVMIQNVRVFQRKISIMFLCIFLDILTSFLCIFFDILMKFNISFLVFYVANVNLF